MSAKAEMNELHPLFKQILDNWKLDNQDDEQERQGKRQSNQDDDDLAYETARDLRDE